MVVLRAMSRFALRRDDWVARAISCSGSGDSPSISAAICTSAASHQARAFATCTAAARTSVSDDVASSATTARNAATRSSGPTTTPPGRASFSIKGKVWRTLVRLRYDCNPAARKSSQCDHCHSKRAAVCSSTQAISRSISSSTPRRADSDLPLRTFRDQGPDVSQDQLHPVDPRAHDADVWLEAVRVEQQAKPTRLVCDPGRQSDCSTLLVSKERHPTPRRETEVPASEAQAPRCPNR